MTLLILFLLTLPGCADVFSGSNSQSESGLLHQISRQTTISGPAFLFTAVLVGSPRKIRVAATGDFYKLKIGFLSGDGIMNTSTAILVLCIRNCQPPYKQTQAELETLNVGDSLLITEAISTEPTQSIFYNAASVAIADTEPLPSPTPSPSSSPTISPSPTSAPTPTPSPSAFPSPSPTPSPIQPPSPSGADFYIGPDGSDLFTGNLAQRNLSGTDGPFATIAGAQNAIRKIKSTTGLLKPIRVFVRGGIYRLSSPITFSSIDSGTATYPISYEAYGSEQPIFTSAISIKGWAKQNTGIWTTTVPEVKAGTLFFRELFVKGRRATPARIPNSGTYFYTAGAGPNPRNSFKYAGNDISPSWTNLNDVIITKFQQWTTAHLLISSVDTANTLVTFANTSVHPMATDSAPYGGGANTRYFAEFVREGLDSPGEWYLDRPTGLLSYYPTSDENLSVDLVEAPTRQDILRLNGIPDSGQFVSHIKFIGLSFHYTDWTATAGMQLDGQAAIDFQQTAAVFARGARNVTIDSCEIAHTGGYGIWFERGSQGNLIIQNHLFDLGAGGIMLGEQRPATGTNGVSSGNDLYNNYIHHGGTVFHAGNGIWIGGTSENKIRNNEVSDFLETGISVGWVWGYDASPAFNNIIEYNSIHHIGQGVLNDMGGVYTLGVSPGTTVRNNRIHDIRGFNDGGWGLYTDEGSTGIVMENNIVYKTDAGFHQNFGHNNTIQNNIFAFSKMGQIDRSRYDSQLSLIFRRNICINQPSAYDGNWQSPSSYSVDNNLYWNSAGAVNFTSDPYSFTQWKTFTGQDAHSLVANPSFANVNAYDFHLGSNSPAIGLGFIPIDESLIGLRGASSWVNLPFSTPLGPR